MGIYYKEELDFESARLWFEKSLAVNPSSLESLQYLSLTYAGFADQVNCPFVEFLIMNILVLVCMPGQLSLWIPLWH